MFVAVAFQSFEVLFFRFLVGLVFRLRPSGKDMDERLAQAAGGAEERPRQRRRITDNILGVIQEISHASAFGGAANSAACIFLFCVV